MSSLLAFPRIALTLTFTRNDIPWGHGIRASWVPARRSLNCSLVPASCQPRNSKEIQSRGASESRVDKVSAARGRFISRAPGRYFERAASILTKRTCLCRVFSCFLSRIQFCIGLVMLWYAWLSSVASFYDWSLDIP